MSFLKPLDPETWAPKALDKFTPEEKRHAAAQIIDSQKTNERLGTPLDAAALKLAANWARELNDETLAAETAAVLARIKVRS